MSASRCHIRTHRRAGRQVQRREERQILLAERLTQEGGFQHSGQFLSPSLQLRVREGLSCPDETPEMGRWIARKTSWKISFQRLNKAGERSCDELERGKLFLFYTQIHGIKNCDATHSLSLNASEYCLDELRGNWASVNPREVKVSLLLSLFLLASVSLSGSWGPESAGGKSFLCQENKAANSYSTFLHRRLPDYFLMCDGLGHRA